MKIFDSHEYVQLYRFDKDIRFGIEVCNQFNDTYYQAIPYISSYPDERIFNTKYYPFDVLKNIHNIPQNYKVIKLYTNRLLLPFLNTQFAGYFQFSILDTYKAIIDVKPDIIFESPYTTLTPRSYQTYAASIKLGIPRVYIDPADIVQKGIIKNIIGKIERRIVNSTGHIITQSELGKKVFVGYYKVNPSKISVIPKPFTPERFKLGKSRFELKDKVRIAYIGRFMRDKDPFTFLKVAKSYQGTPDLEFYLVGDAEKGVDQIIYNSAKEKYGDYVKFLGSLAPNEVSEFFPSVDILIIPDLTNPPGYSTILAEAISSGCALLIGIKGFEKSLPLVEGKHAIYTNPGDVNEIRTALNSLMHDTEKIKAMKTENHNLALSFTWKKVAAMYREILQKAIEER